jgi:hypothetical protein
LRAYDLSGEGEFLSDSGSLQLSATKRYSSWALRGILLDVESVQLFPVKKKFSLGC